MKIITEPKELIARYVGRMQGGRRVGGVAYSAVGLLNDEDELVAGAVFNGYEAPNILMHISAERMTPSFVAAIMHYAFVQAGCTRITGVIDEQNLTSRQFAEHLGAKQEGLMLEAVPGGGNYCIYGLLKRDAAKWLTPRYLRKLERVCA